MRSRSSSPRAYVGTPDFLKILLDAAAKAGKDASSLKRGLVSGAALPPSLRKELAERGVAVKQCYAVAEVGVIAYESDALEGMIVNEDMILEIVRPGTGDPVAGRRGRRGGRHLVQSGLSDDPARDRRSCRPCWRARSPCGRTNTRIKGWMGRADQTTKVKGMFVRPEQIAEVAKRHPELARVRLVVTREGEQDAMTLQAECATPSDGFEQTIAETLAGGDQAERRREARRAGHRCRTTAR